MLVTGVVLAADNSIYIDQTGDNATIAVTQDGTTNVVRGIQGVGSSNTTPAKIYGDGNDVSVSQVGNGNTLNLGVVRYEPLRSSIPRHEQSIDYIVRWSVE